MKLNKRAFVFGLILSILVTYVYAAGEIRYAIYNGAKVIYNGRNLNLRGKRLVSAAKENERYSSNYMPARAVFEAMGLEVGWNSETKTVIVTGSPSEPDYAELYWRPVPETQTSPVEAISAREPENGVAQKTITTPSGLSTRERECYRLATEMIMAEMDQNQGLASIVNVARNTRAEDASSKKQLADALCTALNSVFSEGSKKALTLMDVPNTQSSKEYTKAYNSFKQYVSELERMLSDLKNSDLDGAFADFDRAVDIYLNF